MEAASLEDVKHTPKTEVFPVSYWKQLPITAWSDLSQLGSVLPIFNGKQLPPKPGGHSRQLLEAASLEDGKHITPKTEVTPGSYWKLLPLKMGSTLPKREVSFRQWKLPGVTSKREVT